MRVRRQPDIARNGMLNHYRPPRYFLATVPALVLHFI